jgi:peptide/nickel transport system ATP-binding protein
VGVLYLGRLVEEAAPDDLFDTPKHPYTQMLLAAAPQLGAFGRDVPPPKGEIPDPINPPTGCAYHPRCPLAQDICKAERPEMRVLRGAKVACHLAE